MKINRWNETIACTPEAAPKDIAPDERIAILKELLKKTDSKPIQLLYYLLTRQTDKVRLLFEHYRVYEGDSVEQLPGGS